MRVSVEKEGHLQGQYALKAPRIASNWLIFNGYISLSYEDQIA